MKEPGVTWFLHPFSSMAAFTNIIKYIINCKFNRYFKVLKFFDFPTAYTTVDYSPFIETFTSLSFTNVFSCFSCNLQLHLFSLAGFSSPLSHPCLQVSSIRLHLPNLCLQVRSLSWNPNLYNQQPTQHFHSTVLHFNRLERQSSSFSLVQLGKSNHHLPKSLSQNPGHHLYFFTSHTKSHQFFILKISGIWSLLSFSSAPILV